MRHGENTQAYAAYAGSEEAWPQAFDAIAALPALGWLELGTAALILRLELTLRRRAARGRCRRKFFA